jgi:hypothetical protein
MSDEVDVSNDRWDMYVSMMINKAGCGAAEAVATGECLCCGEELPEGRRWCDADCRDLWQKLEGRK